METLTNYILAWNTRDNAERNSLLEKSFSRDGRYVDPHIPKPVTNLEGMKNIIYTFRERLPHKLTLMGPPEFHNYVFRLHWKMVYNGEMLSKGIFVGEMNTANKISNIICFIDK